MDKNELLGRLREWNDSVMRRLDSLQKDENIPQIEIDLLLNDLRNFYEQVKSLDSFSKSDASPVKNESSGSEDLIANVVPAVKPMKTDELPLEHSDNAEEKHKYNAQIPNQQEALISKINLPDESNEQIRTEEEAILKAENSFGNKPLKEQTSSPVSATLFDVAPEDHTKNPATTSLYEKISSAKEDKSIVTKLQKNPVSDLKKSIGINEKFSFINELFDGDLNAYNDAIEKLNTSNDHESALELIESDFSLKYEWDEDAEALTKLKNLISRRFIA